MKRLLWLAPLALLAGGFWWMQKLRNAPPEVPFAAVKRERLVSSLTTNGKVEPLEWREVRAPREGMIARLAVAKGQSAAKGTILVEIDAADTRSELTAAENRIAQARAELDVIRQGGRPREQAELNAALEKLRADAAIARREVDALQRLVQRKAATQRELDTARERVEQIEVELAAQEKRRGSFVSAPDRTIAEARLKDAEDASAQLRRRLDLSVVRAPIAGVLYQFDVRAGAYVRPGDLIAHIGVLDRVRVNVFVDEPELGNVRTGLPVAITWDAVAGRQWQGSVEKLPAQITALGSRQVGEVQCVIRNEGRQLIPNTNVNAEIRLAVAENVIAIPKETVRREQGQDGVFVRDGHVLRWRPLKLGIASVTRREVLDGLREGELVALPSDTPLKDGLLISPAPGSP